MKIVKNEKEIKIHNEGSKRKIKAFFYIHYFFFKLLVNPYQQCILHFVSQKFRLGLILRLRLIHKILHLNTRP